MPEFLSQNDVRAPTLPPPLTAGNVTVPSQFTRPVLDPRQLDRVTRQLRLRQRQRMRERIELGRQSFLVSASEVARRRRRHSVPLTKLLLGPSRAAPFVRRDRSLSWVAQVE